MATAAARAVVRLADTTNPPRNDRAIPNVLRTSNAKALWRSWVVHVLVVEIVVCIA